MKFALLALTVVFFSGCTHTLYTHRDDFSRPKPKGPWHQAYMDARNKKDHAHPEKRPLFGPRDSDTPRNVFTYGTEGDFSRAR